VKIVPIYKPNLGLTKR